MRTGVGGGELLLLVSWCAREHGEEQGRRWPGWARLVRERQRRRGALGACEHSAQGRVGQGGGRCARGASGGRPSGPCAQWRPSWAVVAWRAGQRPGAGSKGRAGRARGRREERKEGEGRREKRKKGKEEKKMEKKEKKRKKEK